MQLRELNNKRARAKTMAHTQGAKWVERTWNAVKGLPPKIIYTYIYDHNLSYWKSVISP